MINGEKAKWQSNNGKHTMEIEHSITNTPNHKKHVLEGQIHSTGNYNDVIFCRLEGEKLFLSYSGKSATTLSTNYVLGKCFKTKWVIENNVIKSSKNDKLIETYPLAFPDSYFKAGCYAQSTSWGQT